MPQSVQNTYKMFEDFTSRIKSLALTKNAKVEVKKRLVALSLISSDYVLLVYEIFVDNLLNFTVIVRSWVLPDNHELIQSLLKKFYRPFLWMGFNYLKARATSRRQFTFCHKVPRNFFL